MPQRGTGVRAVSEGSFFASGWRPTAAWICVLGLGYQLLMRPLAIWVIENFSAFTKPPALNDETLLTLIMGLLGLGFARTAEKVKGVAS